MTDTTAAPEDRYAPMESDRGWFVHDRVMMILASPTGLTWASAHEKAQRLNREARAALNNLATELRDCAAERYRVALNKIARHSTDEYARRCADDALAIAGRTANRDA